jgi:DNA repair exonuclease SbcCD ATPase subunit
MKLTKLKSLAPVVLEEIKKIESENPQPTFTKDVLPVILGYETATTAIPKPVMEKSSDQKIQPLLSVKRTDPLQVENAKLQQQLREIEQASKKQQSDLQEKNKLLQQRLKKGVKEKSDFERELKSKESEIQSLIHQNTQLKSQLTEVKDQETTLQQKQHQISAELKQIIAAQEQQTVVHKQQESQWTQRLHEQQMAFHSVSAEKRRLETEVTSSQSTVQRLEEKLNQTNSQLTETQEDIERQASYKALDQAETYKTVQALQEEIARLRKLLFLQSSSVRGDNRFTFS